MLIVNKYCYLRIYGKQKSLCYNFLFRVRIVVFGLGVVKKPLFIGASHVIIIPWKIFATLLRPFVEKSS